MTVDWQLLLISQSALSAVFRQKNTVSFQLLCQALLSFLPSPDPLGGPDTQAKWTSHHVIMQGIFCGSGPAVLQFTMDRVTCGPLVPVWISHVKKGVFISKRLFFSHLSLEKLRTKGRKKRRNGWVFNSRWFGLRAKRRNDSQSVTSKRRRIDLQVSKFRLYSSVSC